MAHSLEFNIDGFTFDMNVGIGYADGVVLNHTDADLMELPGYFEALKKVIAIYPVVVEEETLFSRAHFYSPHHMYNVSDEEIEFALRVYPTKYLYEENELIAGYVNAIHTEVARRKKKATEEIAKQERLSRQYPGYVYLVQSPTSAYKIGRTKDYKSRARTFGVQLPFEVEFICVIQTGNMRKLEKELHQRFAEKRVSGEWFNLLPEDVEYIRGLANGN